MKVTSSITVCQWNAAKQRWTSQVVPPPSFLNHSVFGVCHDFDDCRPIYRPLATMAWGPVQRLCVADRELVRLDNVDPSCKLVAVDVLSVPSKLRDLWAPNRHPDHLAEDLQEALDHPQRLRKPSPQYLYACPAPRLWAEYIEFLKGNKILQDVKVLTNVDSHEDYLNYFSTNKMIQRIRRCHNELADLRLPSDRMTEECKLDVQGSQSPSAVQSSAPRQPDVSQHSQLSQGSSVTYRGAAAVASGSKKATRLSSSAAVA